MHKTTFVRNLLIVLCFSTLIFNQSLKAQVTISSPGLGFTQACAKASFNSYFATISYTGTAFSPTNQFIIELSDNNGSFSNPTQISPINVIENSVSSSTLEFSFPTDTAGESYRIRVKSTAPAATSSGSVSFAYYKYQDSPFSINNLEPTAVFCAGGAYILNIDNPGTGLNDSPLNYPSLTYKWYKVTGPTTFVFVDDGESLSVNQAGTYFVRTNYGTCTSDSFSNRVTVTESTTGSTTSITSSLGNPFCPISGPTTLSASLGTNYQWYLNGNVISGATNQTYDTLVSGTYSVSVQTAGCSSSASIALVSEMFTSSINIPVLPSENNLIFGEDLEVIITTNATSPEFIWYLNNVLISNATTNTYLATQSGNYKVIINQTTGCLVSNEFLFKVTIEDDPFAEDVAKIPNLISPNGDGVNDTWKIPNQYRNENAQVMIMNSYGKVVLNTKNYQNNWPENELNFASVNPVYYYVITTTDNKTKKGSITVVK